MKRIWILVSILSMSIFAVGSPSAQLLNQKNILHFVVPYPPGGGDILARTIGTPLGEVLNRTLVIENKPGADGALATEYVKRSQPNGNTLLFATLSQLAAVPAMRKNPPYDPIADFTPISQIGVAGFFLYVNASVPANSIGELVTYAKANPNKLKAGVSNSSSLFAITQLIRSSGIEVVQASYAGDGNAIPALASGEIDMLFATISSARSLVEAGKLKMLATTLPRRSSSFPKVPTLEEEGVRGIEAAPWMGIVGPANLPRAITLEYADAIAKVLAMPSVKERLTSFAIEVESSTPEKLASIIKDSYHVTQKIVSEAKIPQQ